MTTPAAFARDSIRAMAFQIRSLPAILRFESPIRSSKIEAKPSEKYTHALAARQLRHAPSTMYWSAANDPTDDATSCRSSTSSNSRPLGHVLGQRGECRHAMTAPEVPPQSIGRQMQHALVSRELLQRTDAAGRPNDGDQISRLDLGVDVFVMALPHVVHALEREAEVVHDDARSCARRFRAWHLSS